MEVKRQQVYGAGRGVHRKAHTPYASYRDDGRTLATDAGKRVLGEAPDHTARLTLQRRPPLEEAEGLFD